MSHDLIIGGGFAGLATAVELASAGRKVLLLERRSFLGGRAYSFTDRITGDTIDNGQHLMMGCYHQTLGFIEKIGATDKLRFQSTPRVDFLDETQGFATFRCPALPAPLHLVAGLARLGTIGWRDRLSALRVGVALCGLKGNRARLADLTVRHWLDELGQSRRLQNRFWDVIARATLNESPQLASADMFARVIEEAFLRTRKDSEMVIARVGLSELYTDGARNFIEARGGEIRLNSEVERIEVEDDRAVKVHLRGGSPVSVEKTLTSAVPPNALARLLPREVSDAYQGFRQLSQFKSSPIVSINLWYSDEVTNLEFVGLLDSQIDWVFNKNAIGGKRERRQHLALVISGAHEAARLTKEELLAMAEAEMRRFFPAARRERPVHSFVVREFEATISHTVGVSRLRPKQLTPIGNFFLAGDWTDTGLPATIESAVLSGRRCAEAILNPGERRKELQGLQGLVSILVVLAVFAVPAVLFFSLFR